MKTYSILKRIGREFKEAGRVVESDGHIILVGFNDVDEEFFSTIGYGEKGVTPKDGEEYIEALAQVFMFSSNVAVKEIFGQEEKMIAKGGRGSDSWNGPGYPRFQHSSANDNEPAKASKISRPQTEADMKKGKFGKGYWITPIDDLIDLKKYINTEEEHIDFIDKGKNLEELGISNAKVDDFKKLIGKIKKMEDKGNNSEEYLGLIDKKQEAVMMMMNEVLNSGALRIRVSQRTIAVESRRMKFNRIQKLLREKKLPWDKKKEYLFEDSIGLNKEIGKSYIRTNLSAFLGSNSWKEVKEYSLEDLKKKEVTQESDKCPLCGWALLASDAGTWCVNPECKVLDDYKNYI